MKLTIVIENVKDSTKKIKKAMFVIYEGKDGKKEYAASEIKKNTLLAMEFENIAQEMETLIKEKKKAEKLKIKTTTKK